MSPRKKIPTQEELQAEYDRLLAELKEEEPIKGDLATEDWEEIPVASVERPRKHKLLPVTPKYPIRALIIEKRFGGVKFYYDKARRFIVRKGAGSSQSYVRYEFKKTKVKSEPIKNDVLIVNEFGYSLVIVISPQKGQYIPVMPNFETEGLDILSETDKKFALLQFQEDFNRYMMKRDKWLQMLPYVAVGIFLLIMCVSMFIVWRGEIKVFNAIRDGMAYVSNIYKATCGVSGTPPPPPP